MCLNWFKKFFSKEKNDQSEQDVNQDPAAAQTPSQPAGENTWNNNQ
jgi:hypothetical protein